MLGSDSDPLAHSCTNVPSVACSSQDSFCYKERTFCHRQQPGPSCYEAPPPSVGGAWYRYEIFCLYCSRRVWLPDRSQSILSTCHCTYTASRLHNGEHGFSPVPSCLSYSPLYTARDFPVYGPVFYTWMLSWICTIRNL